ncbi:MAG: universal stress protein [Acidimicrobiia bacterium]
MHVLVATDRSELALNVAERGISLLSSPEHVTVLTVITSGPIVLDEEWEESFSPLDERDRRWQAQIGDADAALERTAALFADTRVDRRIEGGDAGRTICDVARELGVDAIVVGSHTRRGLARFRLGSVSEHVVRHAPCPVLIVPAASRASERPAQP